MISRMKNKTVEKSGLMVVVVFLAALVVASGNVVSAQSVAPSQTQAPKSAQAQNAALAQQVEAIYPEAQTLYLDLHEHPELSGHETRTAEVMAGKLRALGYEVTEHVG